MTSPRIGKTGRADVGRRNCATRMQTGSVHIQIRIAAFSSRSSLRSEGPALVPPQSSKRRATFFNGGASCVTRENLSLTKRHEPGSFALREGSDVLPRHVHNMREANVEVVAPAYVKRRSRIRA